MSLEQVQRFRSAAEIDFGDKVALIPPPGSNREHVALLHCHWRHNDGHRQCRLYYGLWEVMTTHPHPELLAPASFFAFSAHRIELPERGANHNYHHSQYCTSLGLNGPPGPKEAIKLSVTYPAWPIAATDELELALCFIVALYGFDGFTEFEDYVRGIARWRQHQVLTDAIAVTRRLQS